ncbi:MAG: hypothetical protein ACREH8_14530, partial [Opitutaceae bacterium]
GVARSSVRVVPGTGWHGAERHLRDHWRWTSGRAELALINESTEPVLAIVRGEATSAGGIRSVRVLTGERLLWGDHVGGGPAEFRFGLTLPPGETVLVFVSDRRGEKVSTDPRDLAFQITNLDIVVKPAPAPR